AKRRAALGDKAGNCLKLETAAVANRDHTGKLLGRAFGLQFGDKLVARTAEALPRLIVDCLVGDRKEVGVADVDARRQRNCNAQLVTLEREVTDRRNR